MTLEHANLIYCMYRNALSALMHAGPDQSWKARAYDWWLARWLAVPDAIVAKMGIA